MRYAIVSDLHANRSAFKAVIADIASNDVDKIVCLGDVVGYGPNPAEVLEMAYSKIHFFVLGNHDAVIAGKISPECFNENARRALEWTFLSLDRKAAKFFSSLPLDAKGGNMRCAHAEFANPGRFGYIFDPVDAEDSFKSCSEQVLFSGHSHVPGIFVMGDRKVAHWLDPIDFGIEDEKRYIVNVGSVGQPRDNDTRASYCIYDTDKKDVLFRKVAFDIEEYISELRKSGIPSAPSYFIDIYHKQAPRPIRELIDFHRMSEDRTVKAGSETADLQKTVAKLRKTRLILLVMLVITAAFLFILVFCYSSEKNAAEKARKDAEKTKRNLADATREISKLQKTTYGGLSYSNTAIPPKGELMIDFPLMQTAVSKLTPLKEWMIQLDDPEAQKISVEKFDGQNTLKLSSSCQEEISISSKAIPAFKGMRFAVTYNMMTGNSPAGNLEILFEQILEDTTRRTVCLNTIEGIKDSGKWKKKSMTEEKPLSENGKMLITIRGSFKGNIMFRNLILKRVD